MLLAAVSVACAQRLEVRPAPVTEIPFTVDGNSPVYWRDGRLQFFTSTGVPVRAEGSDQFSLSRPTNLVVDRDDHMPMWMEAIWVDTDGTVYGWYHNEPGGVCPGGKLTVPRIGAAVSYDGGERFYDLGLVLTSGDPADCNSQNGFFAGGHGDLSVIPDREQKYFYFLFTNYGGAASSQGVVMARMAIEDRKTPVGAAWKYYQGEWMEPGLGGRVTPIFPAAASWQRSDTNSFWGPAVHWNTVLESYVVLLNHACCSPNWPQDGIYVTFNGDLSDVAGWTAPVRILNNIGWAPGYYPQVLGLGPGETDTLAGESARLYVHGRSKWELHFVKDGQVSIGSDVPEPAPPGERLDQVTLGPP
ncbi:MAG: hypothetical protein HY822_05265 [Acidobacteria bacterium]|nr:hypothetical protein [Acidobacteriota bacterium]